MIEERWDKLVLYWSKTSLLVISNISPQIVVMILMTELAKSRRTAKVSMLVSVTY